MKIKAQTLRDYLSVHSWVGIVCGLLLFIAFYAGAFSMLEPEIRRWTQAPSPSPGASPDPDQAIAQFLAQHPEARGRISLRLASADHPTPLIKTGGRKEPDRWWELQPDGVVRQADGGQEADNSGNFVDYLHRKGGLPLPLDWAEPVIGIVSLLYALALISGVVVLLPSLVKDLLHLRIGANFKRMWLDVHNLLGIASLPFHVVIALSAAVFGLHDWIYAAQDKFIYAEGLQKTVQRDGIQHPTIERTDWLTPTQLIGKLREQEPGFTPQVIDYVGVGSKQTTLFVAGTDDRHFKRGAQYGYAFVNLATGEIYGRMYFPGEKNSALSASLTSFFSLHFGSYGGNPVRVLYVLLGLSGALLFYTGNLLWIESRTKRMRKTQQIEHRPRHVRVMASATLGVCLGTAAGLPVALVAARWLAPWIGTASINTVHQSSFYLVFLICVMLALRMGLQRAATPLLWCAAACNALVPLTAALLSIVPPNWLTPLQKPHQSGFLFLELLCLLLALFFGWLAWRQQHPSMALPLPPQAPAAATGPSTTPIFQNQAD